MTVTNNKNIFLFGDSIIENSRYTNGKSDVTTCLSELWPNKVVRVAWDGGVMDSIKTQYDMAMENGFNPENDIAIVSVIGNNMTNKVGVLVQKTVTVSDAMVTIHKVLSPLYEEYTNTIKWLKEQGVKNLALVTIYPVHDFTRYGIADKKIDNKSLTWVLVTPFLALVNMHIRTTANAFGAKVVDLFHGQINEKDVVYSIEPGATASPKIAALMAETASSFVS
jgi:hypothetical protein